jgi:lipopolysaccharide/colanic/teichoic acid biosynthesis glycosyltransferase
MKLKNSDDISSTDKEYCKSCGVEERFINMEASQKIDDANKFFNTATIDMPKINLEYKNKPVYDFVKRFFDILLSGFALVVLSPLFLLTIFIIKIQDGGKVFFIQKRVGRNGKKFNMFKFRSMRPDAEEEIVTLLDKNEATGPMFKIKNDPRITKFGKVIRKTSIDELPQLFNIFRGSMSIVGPRPALPREANLYREDQKYRFLVKPGLTCIWQVSGRSNITFEQQVAMDKEYIRRRNLLLDVVLIFKTIPAVVRHDGAV